MRNLYLLFYTTVCVLVIWSLFTLIPASANITGMEFICGLTNEKPFYDCDDTWIIFIVEKSPISLCSKPLEEPVFACVYNNLFLMFIPEEKVHDDCGRTILHHEILHIVFPDLEKEIDKDKGELCRNWY